MHIMQYLHQVNKKQNSILIQSKQIYENTVFIKFKSKISLTYFGNYNFPIHFIEIPLI